MRWLFASSSDNDDRVVQGRGRYPSLADGSGVILVGHSVGATIAFGVALGLGYHGDEEDGFKDLRRRIKAVVGVEGIYDFTALRDVHIEHRDVYEEFTNGAFGDEGAGEWEKGDIVKKIREGGKMYRVEVVVLGQSTEDELVDWGQIEMMGRALQEKGWRRGEDVEGAAKEVTVVELKGRHDEIWEKGEQLARCISVAVDRCVGRSLDGGC